MDTELVFGVKKEVFQGMSDESKEALQFVIWRELGGTEWWKYIHQALLSGVNVGSLNKVGSLISASYANQSNEQNVVKV